MKGLVELRIGTRGCKLVGNNDDISREVFEEVLLSMKELTVLDMPLPAVRELNLRKFNDNAEGKEVG